MAKLVSRLSVIADGMDSAISEALNETADFILTMVRIFAPVDTGRLRDSYEKKQDTPLSVLIGSSVNYAIFQEYGTSRQSGTPHLIPAFALGEQFLRNKLIAKIESL